LELIATALATAPGKSSVEVTYYNSKYILGMCSFSKVMVSELAQKNYFSELNQLTEACVYKYWLKLVIPLL